MPTTNDPATITVRSPYDDSVIGEIPAMTAADVDAAVAIAKKALHDNPLPLWKRADILDKAAARLTARRDWPDRPDHRHMDARPGARLHRLGGLAAGRIVHLLGTG